MKTYGKPFTVNGIECVHTLPWYKRAPFHVMSGIQFLLWKIGIDWHMKIFGGQCTPDFSCCRNKDGKIKP